MGLISRLIGKDQGVVTSTVDDFLKIGSSVSSKRTRSLVSEVSQFLRDIDFENLDIEFQGQDTSVVGSAVSSIGKRIRGADIVRHTIAGVFDDAAVRGFGLSGIAGGVAHHTGALPGSKKHAQLISFFKSQGIDVPNPDEVKSFLFFSKDEIPKSLADRVLLLGHETRTRSVKYIWCKR